MSDKTSVLEQRLRDRDTIIHAGLCSAKEAQDLDLDILRELAKRVKIERMREVLGR